MVDFSNPVWADAAVQFFSAWLAFLAAYALFQMQRRSDRDAFERQAALDDANATTEASAKRNALLHYLAAEIRRNYNMTTGLASLVAKTQETPFPDVPYYPTGLDDQAYHACLSRPESRMDRDQELLDALVDGYSAIPVWQVFEQQLMIESRSEDVQRRIRAWAHAAGMKEALDGQAAHFLKIHQMLLARGISAQTTRMPSGATTVVQST